MGNTDPTRDRAATRSGSRQPPTRKPARGKSAAKAGAAKKDGSPRGKAASASRQRKPRPGPEQAAAPITSDERTGLIARAAYLRAEQRGFVGGDPVEDWLAAEREVDAALTRGRQSAWQAVE
ncbi:MAG TPA: DUF2934 domain-containing protein [Gammaproteobacteria bacterium]|nr:DUF2934 domain-containing protein [Gammaproteobacteria bacterium]